MSDSVNLALRAALDLRWQRHEVLSNNLANADTPGFKPKDLEFEAVLQGELTAGETPATASRATQAVIDRPAIVDTLDENSVDTDRELAKVADNSVQYGAAMEVLRRRYGMVREVLADLGRG